MLSRWCGEFYMTFHSNLYHNQLIPTESNQLFFSDHIRIREYHKSTSGAENLRNESTLKMNLDLSCSILLFLSTLSFSLQVLSFTCWKLMIQNLCKLKMKSICKQTGCLATENDINNDSLGDFNLVLYGWENSGRPDERRARVSVYVIKIVCCFMIETVIRPPPPINCPLESLLSSCLVHSKLKQVSKTSCSNS